MAQARPVPRRQLLLSRGDIDVVIVHGVKRGRGRRRHPGGIRARFGVGDFRLDHLAHLVRHRPHPFADLRLPRKPRFDADVHVPVFISFDPRLGFDLLFWEHRTQLHARVNLVAGPIQEASVDKYHPLLCLADACFEIDRGAALFVHDADLEGVALQPKGVFHALTLVAVQTKRPNSRRPSKWMPSSIRARWNIPHGWKTSSSNARWLWASGVACFSMSGRVWA